MIQKIYSDAGECTKQVLCHVLLKKKKKYNHSLCIHIVCTNETSDGKLVVLQTSLLFV